MSFERKISDKKIDEIMNLGYETEWLDYKLTFNINDQQSLVAIVKDIIAMANSQGGYLVFGIDDKSNLKVGLPFDFHIDEATLRNKISSYLNVHVNFEYKEFFYEINGEKRKFAIIKIDETDDLVLPSKDGSYIVKKRQKFEFHKGDLIVRIGSESKILREPKEIKHFLDTVLTRKLLKKHKKYHQIVKSILNSSDPDDIQELLYSNLFEVTKIPPIYSAPIKEEILRRLTRDQKSEFIKYIAKTFGETNLPSFILKENKIFTFSDLQDETNPLRYGIIAKEIMPVNPREWISDENKARYLVELLNVTLKHYCIERGLSFDKEKKRFFFKTSYFKSDKEQDFVISYQLGGRKQERRVIKMTKLFYEHVAAKISFIILGEHVFLKVIPTYLYTVNGKNIYSSKGTAKRSIRKISKRYNYVFLKDIRFWVAILKKQFEYEIIVRPSHHRVGIYIRPVPLIAQTNKGILSDYDENTVKRFSDIEWKRLFAYLNDKTKQSPMDSNQSKIEMQKSSKKQQTQLMTNYIKEPTLLFGENEHAIDPKFGISVFGPYNMPEEKSSIPQSIRVGIIGNSKLISITKNWLEKCKTYIKSGMENNLLFPDFRGFTQENTFRCDLLYSEAFVEKIKAEEIEKIKSISDPLKRICKAVEIYTTKVKLLSEREPTPDVIICTIPEEIYKVCKSAEERIWKSNALKQRIKNTLKRIYENQKMTRLTDFINLGTRKNEAEQKINLCFNFRRTLKGEVMKYGVPIQIMLYRTLLGQGNIEDEATRAWNFTLALYYKAGGLPWKIANIDPNTCYVGISFYKDKLSSEENLRTSIAQIFTTRGDSLVLKGEQAQVSKDDRRPHLSEDAAFKLLEDVIQLFKNHTKQQPTRIVLHKTSRFQSAEKRGFLKAAEKFGVSNLIMVAFGSRGIRFVRLGKYPPLRGTLIHMPGGSYILFTSGYVPFLKTYPGPRIPYPLEILEIHGDEDPTIVAKEILALTKMNWNSAKFYSRIPMTIRFSREVGKILSELHDKKSIQQHYRFYM